MQTSLTFFRRARLKHVALVRFGRNSTCLCQKHQNIALKQRAIKQLGMPTSPNVLCTQVSNEEFEERLSTLVASTVKFEEWGRIEITLSEGKSTTRIWQVRDEVPTEQSNEGLEFRVQCMICFILMQKAILLCVN